MGRKKKKGSNLVAKIVKGFCISCRATTSVAFRVASEKWEQFYVYRHAIHKEKKNRICNTCYTRLLAMETETTTNADRREAINPIIKKSPIGGNGT